MSHREYNKEPDFNSYRKNALYSLQQIASEANILPKQKNLVIRPPKSIVVTESSNLSPENSLPRKDQPQSSPLVILNSIKDIYWPNEDYGWIFIKNGNNEDTKNGK
jgi:hypothetical protein